jgi:UPF0716 protein FxsA
MLARLVLLFALVPLVELFLLLKLAQVIEFGPTVALVLGTGVVGAWLVRRQGVRTLALIREDLAAGRMPADRILSGVFILVGGAFLVTPGILTDVAGFLLMVPGNRRFLAHWLRQRASDRMQSGGGEVFFFHVGPGGATPGRVRDITEEVEVWSGQQEESCEGEEATR